MSVSISKKHITLQASDKSTLSIHVSKEDRETSTFREFVGRTYDRIPIYMFFAVIVSTFVYATACAPLLGAQVDATPASPTTTTVYPSFVKPTGVVLHKMQSPNGRYTATFEPSCGVIRIADKEHYFDRTRNFGYWFNQYYFKYQKDGNFVVYNLYNNDCNHNYGVAWASDTNRQNDGHTLRLTNDGKLCIFENDTCVRPIMSYN